MDALAHRRRARGAHALSINWGSWSEASAWPPRSMSTHRRRWASMGLAMIEPEDGVRMLQDLLYANRTAQAAALPLVRGEAAGQSGAVLCGADDASRRGRSKRRRETARLHRPPTCWPRLATAADGERVGLLSTFLAEQVVKVLALGASYKVDLHRSLMDLGMDSLMAMELRNRMQSSLKLQVAIVDLLKGPSIHELSRQLLAGQ